ncbi:MAG: ABC transporter permease [Bacteroidota bacterium]
MLQIAFRFMLFDKSKTLGATVGVIVAIFLIGQQTGIFLFLTGLMDALVSNTQAKVWVVGDNVKDVNNLSAINIRRGNEIRSVKGVKNVNPFVIVGSTIKLENGKTAPVQIIGSLAPTFIGGPWNIVEGDISQLVHQGGIAADKYDLANLGDIQLGDELSLGGKLVELRAITKGARGFGANYIFTNISLARKLGQFPVNEVSAFLVNIEKGYTPAEIANEINEKHIGIKAWTKRQFSWSTITKILKDGGIGESIGSLIIFAIIAGGVIIGLTLYSAAKDRIDDYATMKAIGAYRKVVTSIILLQASVIASAGFAIAAMLIQGFKLGVRSSGVRFSFPWYIWLLFFILTLIISLSGAYFASKSIRNVKPSKVF